MLAPCFKTADELGLNPSQRDALIKVLGQLERGELTELDGNDEVGGRTAEEGFFSMRSWSTCLCGHASRYADFAGIRENGGPTGQLFYRTSMNMAQATNALRDYLCGHGA